MLGVGVGPRMAVGVFVLVSNLLLIFALMLRRRVGMWSSLRLSSRQKYCAMSGLWCRNAAPLTERCRRALRAIWNTWPRAMGSLCPI